jgi:hypothetical protein
MNLEEHSTLVPIAFLQKLERYSTSAVTAITVHAVQYSNKCLTMTCPVVHALNKTVDDNQRRWLRTCFGKWSRKSFICVSKNIILRGWYNYMWLILIQENHFRNDNFICCINSLLSHAVYIEPREFKLRSECSKYAVHALLNWSASAETPSRRVGGNGKAVTKFRTGLPLSLY